ncbi:unnamed protein product [Choristocarpus tenellus]
MEFPSSELPTSGNRQWFGELHPSRELHLLKWTCCDNSVE